MLDSSTGPLPTDVLTFSTVDGLSYTRTPEEKDRDTEHLAATGRRAWRTLKGKLEAVWPPLLEDALIDGLREYQKLHAPPTVLKNGFRFPLRNRFISNYIQKQTGKPRTPKQVGSRLQVLRDTCKDPALAALLRKKPLQRSERGSSRTRTPSPSPEPVDNSCLIDSCLIVYMQIDFPTVMRTIDRVPRIPFESNDIENPHSIILLPAPDHLVAIDGGSSLSHFSNLVNIVSPWHLAHETSWAIYQAQDSTAIHRETSFLRRVSSTPYSISYACEIVPSFWNSLCQYDDPNVFTLVQVLSLASNTAATSENSITAALPTTSPSTFQDIHIVYHFNYQGKPSRRDTASRALNVHHQSPPSSQYPSPAPSSSTSGTSSTSYDTGSSASSYWAPGPSDTFRFETFRFEVPTWENYYHAQAASSDSSSFYPVPTTSSQTYALYSSQSHSNYDLTDSHHGPSYAVNTSEPPQLYAEPTASYWTTPTDQSPMLTLPQNSYGHGDSTGAYWAAGGVSY